jgi:hypothetical protein
MEGTSSAIPKNPPKFTTKTKRKSQSLTYNHITHQNSLRRKRMEMSSRKISASIPAANPTSSKTANL